MTQSNPEEDNKSVPATHDDHHIESDNSVLDVDAYVAEDDNFSDDDFDFDNDDQFNDDDNDDQFDNHHAEPNGRTVNWFNIILISGVVLAIGGAGYTYLPDVINGSKGSTRPQQQAQQQNTPITAAATTRQEQPSEAVIPTAEKQKLAQQVVEMDLNTDSDTKNQQTPTIGGLLNNPDLLSEQSNQAALDSLSDNYSEQIFDSLNTTAEPTMAVDNSLANYDKEISKPLPQASDSIAQASEYNNLIIDDMANFNTTAAIDTTIGNQNNPSPETTDAADLMALESLSQMPVIPTQINNSASDAPLTNDNTVTELQHSIPSSASIPSPILDNQVTQLSSRMDGMADQLNKLMVMMENNTNNNAPTNQMSNSDVSQDDLNRLEKMVLRLDKKIQSMESKPNVVAKTPAATSAKVRQRTAPIQSVAKQKPVQAPVLRQQPATSHVANTAAPSHPDNLTATVPLSSQWELRGASPGQAYISEKGSQIMRTIRVGDQVNGVGRVQSIAVENNRWVVRGPQAMISQ